MSGVKGMLLITLLVARPAAPAGDGWFGIDKVKHFLVSAFIQSVTFAALETAGADRRTALAGASGVTMGVGLAREWHDRRRGGPFSVRDLSWDAAGAGAASLVLIRTER